MKLGFENRVAIVTGAGNGIGRAIATTLVEEGAHVVVADIDGDQAERTAAGLAGRGGSALAVRADITSEDEVQALVDAAMARFGRIDALVNNAGFTRDMRITKMQLSDWSPVLDVILTGSFLCTRAVTPAMQAAGYGRIVNISSRAHLGNPGQANYSAAKAGVIGFTKAMALELGRNGITVNAVAPGLIGTEALHQLPHFDKIRENAERNTPIRRIGNVEDVADAVLFLASERAGYITGEVVHVSGGRY